MFLRNVITLSTVNILRAVLQFVTNILVAAFVPPHEYGLVSFSMPFIVFATIMSDMGLASAIVQSQKVTPRLVGSAFTLMCSLGLVLTLAIAVCSPWVELLANLPGLALILSVLSATILLSMTAVVPRAVLERELKYPKLSLIEGLALVVGWCCSVAALVLASAGIWAVVCFQITVQLVRATLLLIAVRRQFVLSFEWTQLRPLARFGGWNLATNLLNFVARNADNIIVGVALGAAALGIYNLAFQFMTVPLLMITWPASSVLFASLSSMRSGAEEFGSLPLAVLFLTSMLTFPAMVLLSLLAPFALLQLLSSQWSELGAAIAIMAPVGAIQSIAAYGGAILLARGRSKLQFYLTLANAVVLLSVLALAARYSLLLVVKCYAAIMATYCILTLVLMCTWLQISLAALLRSVAPACVATLLGLAAIRLLAPSEVQSWATLAGTACVYSIAVIMTYLAFWKQIVGAMQQLFETRAQRDAWEA